MAFEEYVIASQLLIIVALHNIASFPRERSAACIVLNPVAPHAARATHGSYRDQRIASKPLRRMTWSRTSVGPFGLSVQAQAWRHSRLSASGSLQTPPG